MFITNQPPKFYTYIHRRKSDGSVFYVGKGHGHRAHWPYGRNPKWHATKSKHGLIVEIVRRFDVEADALAHERELIQEYRAAGARLCNLTDGGEGTSGRKPDDGEKARLSAAQRATWARPGYKERHRAAFAHILASAAFREKRRQNMKQRWSDPTRRPRVLKHGENGRARAVRCMETGTVFASMSLAVIWLQSMGVAAPGKTRINACCQGLSKSAYGYHWHYAEQPPTEAEVAWRLEGYSKGARHYAARAVRCIETGYVFPTATEAVAWLSANIGPATSGEMSSCCKFEQRHVRGHHFHFEDTPPSAAQLAWMYEGRPSGARAYCARQIECVEIGRVFETITAATAWIRTTINPKASIGNISSCALHGKPKSAYGYHWRFK